MNDSYNTCRTCGAFLPEGFPCYAGYSADASPVYVGECCKTIIAELATHVYWWWEVDKRVESATMLWRYVDFARFVALLDQRALHFARADLLGDPFEAASGVSSRRHEWDAHYLEFFRNAIRTAPGQDHSPSDEYVEREAARLLREFSNFATSERMRLFVNCWHANAGESEALWRLYCPPPAAGVAIQTTAARFVEAIGDAPVKLGKVQYIDFDQAFAPTYGRIFSKRRSLSHESEVRAVIQDFDHMDDTGISSAVDLDMLLVAVVPSPFAPVWFTRLVESTLRRYGVSTAVRQSELLAEPFF